MILHRDKASRNRQTFLFDGWLGGFYGSSGILGTKPGGPIAAGWAALQYLGVEGYVDRSTKSFRGRAAAWSRGSAPSRGSRCSASPTPRCAPSPPTETSAVAVDPFAVGDGLRARGWHLDRQGPPDSLHATCMPIHDGTRDGRVPRRPRRRRRRGRDRPHRRPLDQLRRPGVSGSALEDEQWMGVDPAARPLRSRQRQQLVDGGLHETLEVLVGQADEPAEEALPVALDDLGRRLLERLRLGRADGHDAETGGLGRRPRLDRPLVDRRHAEAATELRSIGIRSHGSCSIGCAITAATRPPWRKIRRHSAKTAAWSPTSCNNHDIVTAAADAVADGQAHRIAVRDRRAEPISRPGQHRQRQVEADDVVAELTEREGNRAGAHPEVDHEPTAGTEGGGEAAGEAGASDEPASGLVVAAGDRVVADRRRRRIGHPNAAAMRSRSSAYQARRRSNRA